MSAPASIIVCANPRSGSTMLCDLMTATGVLGRPASYYRWQSIPEWASRWGVDDSQGTTSKDFERDYLSAVRQHGTDASGVFGLRLMWDTVEGLTKHLQRIFPDEDKDAALFETAFGTPLYISLVREDKVAQAVSLVRAEQSGLWHLAFDRTVRQGEQKPRPTTYNAEIIEDQIAALSGDDAAWQAWFIAQDIVPLKIVYEDLASDPLATLRALLTASGQDPAKAKGIKPATAQMADGESELWIKRYRGR